MHDRTAARGRSQSGLYGLAAHESDFWRASPPNIRGRKRRSTASGWRFRPKAAPNRRSASSRPRLRSRRRKQISGTIRQRLLCAGQYAEAGAAQRRSLDCDPAQPQGWLLLAAIDSALGDAAAAETGYRAALKLDPHLSEAAFGLGILCFQRRQLTEAVTWLRQSIADGGHHMGLYVCLGQALFLLGDFAAAVSALESAARFPPAMRR